MYSTAQESVMDIVTTRISTTLEKLDVAIPHNMELWTTLAVCRKLKEFRVFELNEINNDLLSTVCSLPLVKLVVIVGTCQALEWSNENLQAIIKTRIEHRGAKHQSLDLLIYCIRDFAAIYYATKDILESAAVRWWVQLPVEDFLKRYTICCEKLLISISH